MLERQSKNNYRFDINMDKNLAGNVKNGGEAMTIFPQIKDMSTTEAAAARESLLRYCELDTWAMVKVWEKLKEVISL